MSYLCYEPTIFLDLPQKKSPGLVDSESDEHGAVSVGSPSQASAKGALLQFRNLNFLPLEQEGLHSDQTPHSAQTPATANKK